MEVQICPKCGNSNRLEAKFCNKCGIMLNSAKESNQSDLLIPLFYWIKERIWDIQWFKFILFIFVVPFILFHLLTFTINKKITSDVLEVHICWLTSAYWSIIWACLLYFILKLELFTIFYAIGISVFTAFLGTIMAFVISELPIIRTFYKIIGSESSLMRILGFILGVGFTEEFIKMFPLAYLAIKIPKFEEKRLLIFLGMCSGLGFGITEAVYYISGFTPLINLRQILEHIPPVYETLFHLLRSSILPFLHGMWTAIMGYYISLFKQGSEYNLSAIITGLAICSILHGMYNSLALSLTAILVVILSILIFAGCVCLAIKS